MAATILAATDFDRWPEAKIKVTNTEAFIDDRVVVNNYWYNLADKVSVPVENLPTAPSELVKEYLIYSVLINIAESSLGSNIVQISEDITVDQWEGRLTSYTNKRNELLSDIKASNVYDPNNEPDNVVSNSMLSSFNRG